MEMQKVFSKKKIGIYIIMIVQIYALTFLGQITMEFYQALALFGSGVEFRAVRAECVDIHRVDLSNKANSPKVYNNTYEFEVDGQIYSVTFEGEDDKGEDCVLYYKTSRPEICSRYCSISHMLSSQSGKLLLALVMQGIVIVYFVWRRKNREISNVNYE